MQRVLEPELMDTDEQASVYAAADFEEPHGRFIQLFQNVNNGKNISGSVLDIGCGPGDISVRFAKAFPHCGIHAVDGSLPMLSCGEKLLNESGEAGSRIELIHGILPRAILPLPKYDIIISNSLLHHLHNPQTLWEFIKIYAHEQTIIFIMDLKRPESADQAQSYVEEFQPKAPELLKSDFYNSLLAAFSVSEIEDQLKSAGLNKLIIKEVDGLHVTICGTI